MRFNNKIFHISLSIILFLVFYIYNNEGFDIGEVIIPISPDRLEYIYIEEDISFSPNYQNLGNKCSDSTLEYNL